MNKKVIVSVIVVIVLALIVAAVIFAPNLLDSALRMHGLR